MFYSYLVVAVRNISRNKLTSFVNIAGLTLALACAVCIMALITGELSYDSFIPGMANVYRVDFSYRPPGLDVERTASSIFPLGEAMKAKIPQVLSYTNIMTARVTLKANGRLFAQEIEVVSPDFFNVIHLALAEGQSEEALAAPNSIVLSQKEALKLFGLRNPIGKTVTVNGTYPMTVTAIAKDLPYDTQLKADVLIPNTSKADPTPDVIKRSWTDILPYLFVRVVPGTHPTQVLNLVRQLIRRHLDQRSSHSSYVPQIGQIRPHLTQFRDAHLSNYGGGMTPRGSWLQIYGLTTITVLILFMASLNFTNLATAAATIRAREVALRKALGARRGQLIVQYLAESIVTAIIALILALMVVEILSPAISGYIGRSIHIGDILSSWRMALVVAGATLVTGLLGGIYPALILSNFQPASILRSNLATTPGSGRLRSGLLVLQFAISIGLAIGAIFVFGQIRFARQLDLGFNRSHVVIVSNVSKMAKAKREDFARALASAPSIIGTALSREVPFGGMDQIEKAADPSLISPRIVEVWECGFNFFQVYQMKLIEGRLLSNRRSGDTSHDGGASPTNVVISRKAAQVLGYTPVQAVGRTIRLGRNFATIVGVVANQRLDGPQESVQPIIFLHTDDMNQLSVRVAPGQSQAALHTINVLWHKYAPNVAVERYFLGDAFDKLFKGSIQRGRMLALFVCLAIVIACLGLYGLSAITAQHRTKEIGIRKVFGASTTELVFLLLWQFSIPVLLANIIAWPIAWFCLNQWLEGFAARVWLNPLYFVGVGAAALLIAWGTIVSRAVAVSRASPVNSLRYE